jgi:hypothetical protein
MNINDLLQIDLIKHLGLDNLPPEKKEEVILKMSGVIQQNILLRILRELDEKDKDEFDKILGEDNNEKTLEFLKNKLPNLDDLVKEEIAKFKENIIERMQGLIPQS